MRRLLLPLLSITIFLGSGEVMLRVLYRDAGRRTLGGPGGQSFDHLSNRGDERGRFDVGPRRAGVPRIMAMGDSVTYGQGVRDWRDVWPEILATTFERAGQPIEMAVFAVPGRGLPEHVEYLRHWGPIVQPDTLIYQWYVNDIEVLGHRPEPVVPWQQWSSHRYLRSRSYLYFFLDRFAAARLQAGAYLNYILHDFVPGTREWSEFERHFHDLATLAKSHANQRLLLLYPQVPYGNSYPLQPIHDRVHAMAGAHRLAIPPAAWVRSGGTVTPDASAPWKHVVAIPAGVTGSILDTSDYLFMPGTVELTVSFSVPSAEGRQAPVGALELVDALSNEMLVSVPLHSDARTGTLQTTPVHTVLPGTAARRVRCRIRSTGGVEWRVAEIAMTVDYGMTVVELAPALNTFNTHVSIFDAHPNEAAHRVIAEEVYRALGRTKN